jgi:hypothetical protein
MTTIVSPAFDVSLRSPDARPGTGGDQLEEEEEEEGSIRRSDESGRSKQSSADGALSSRIQKHHHLDAAAEGSIPAITTITMTNKTYSLHQPFDLRFRGR